MGAFIFGIKEIGMRTGEGVNETPVGSQSRADRAPSRRESESLTLRHKRTETLIQGFSPFLYVLAES